MKETDKKTMVRFKRLTPKQLAIGLSALALGVLLVVGLVIFLNRKPPAPLKFSEQVEYWALEYGVEPMIVYSIILTESGFQPEAESSAGARGLMQITEETFDWIKSKIAPDEALVFDDLYTPEVAIRFGTYYISRCLGRYGGDLSTAAAAYHSGWGTVDKLLKDSRYSKNGTTLDSFPYAQMKHYVHKINLAYENYQKQYKE